MRPVVCMVTDRHRLEGASVDRLVRHVAAAARAGVHLIQIRERDLEAGALLTLAERCVDAVRRTPSRILVNDRLDVALAAGAHGVHLRAQSLPAARLRAIAPAGFIVGRSVHSVEEASAAGAAGGLDYLIFGTVFPTSSKPGAPAAGLETLSQVAAASLVPVLAIGGVTSDTVGRVGQAGAAGFAAIGLFLDANEELLPEAVSKAARAFEGT